MWEFNAIAALRTLENSMAYVLFRFGLCLGAAVGALLLTLAGAGTLVGFASLAKNASAIGPIGASLGFLLFGLMLLKLRTVWLRGVDLPHLALLAKQWERVTLPSGKALIAFAHALRDQAYPSGARLEVLTSNIKAVQSHLALENNQLWIERFPTSLQPAAKLAVSALAAKGHRVTLAWYFSSHLTSPELSARASLAVEARHGNLLLKNRLAALALTWIGFILAYPLVLKGIEILTSDIPIQMGFWPFVFAGVFAWALKAAFLDPLAEAALLQLTFPLLQSEASGSEDPALLRIPAYQALVAEG